MYDQQFVFVKVTTFLFSFCSLSTTTDSMNSLSSIGSQSSMQSPTSTMGSPTLSHTSHGMHSPPLSSPPMAHSHSGGMHNIPHSPMQSPMSSMGPQSMQEDIKPVITIPPPGMTHSMGMSMSPLPLQIPGTTQMGGPQTPQSSMGGLPGTSMNKGICAVCGDRASGKFVLTNQDG